MEFLDLAKERYSVLYYSNKKIEEDVLNKILQAGMLAPTACNFQPQRILVINERESKEKLNRITKSKLYFDTALLVCYDKREAWIRPCDKKSSGEIDASIVTTHMMLEAASLGVGSIWVMSWNPDEMAKAFDLSDDLEPIALLVMGYAAENEKPRPTHFKTKNIEDILL